MTSKITRSCSSICSSVTYTTEQKTSKITIDQLLGHSSVTYTTEQITNQITQLPMRLHITYITN